VARIRGFSTSTPVLVVGGGDHGCEDADNAAPSCGQAKGGFIYILNADTGALLRKFRTDRPVPSDVAMVDINNDASPDYAYAADTGGNIYRIDFIDGPTTRIPLSDTQWTSRKVATTAQNSGRKFLHSPALLYSQNKVYVALGSGDREHPMVGDYPYVSNVVNRFYVYLDNLSAAATSDAVNLDGMRDHTLTDSCTTAAVLPDSGLAGWFMDLSPNGRGEQVVTSALIAGGMVTFSTNRPIPEPRASCATTLGEARGYWVNLLNGAGAIGVPGACGGTRSSVFVGGGLPPSPVFANGVGIGTGTQSDTVSVVLGAVQKDGQGVNTPISPVEMRPQISMKRKRAYSYSKGD
jgi:Tfp pilus tip-associated adhesin PilY1